ncbi:MAG: cyclic nucleotide-binding domain-containing protein [Spirochaetota bacterium]
MSELALLSGDEVLLHRVEEVAARFDGSFQLSRVTSWERVPKYLSFEFPHVTIVNVDEPGVNGYAVLAEMKRDPWLHSGALIIVHQSSEETVAALAARGLNLVALIPYDLVGSYLPRALRILHANQQILYQRDIHLLLRAHHSGSFVLDNDPFDLVTYSRLLANFLFNTNLIGDEQRDRFHVALLELLVNAVEHGNCGITYEEKSRYLEEHGDSLELIRRRSRDPAVAARRVYLSYRISPERTRVTIRDDGAGFDWRSYRTARGEDGLGESHGRGILMAGAYIDELAYNDAGNEVTMTIVHGPSEDPVLPRPFSSVEEVRVGAGDRIITEGEASTHLYYIVSGRYDVSVGGRRVSTLTPSDVFVGEMSFLLNNRRSATVTATGDGLLLRIDKEQFLQAVRDNPHYGVILARLLASRLVALHHLPD